MYLYLLLILFFFLGYLYRERLLLGYIELAAIKGEIDSYLVGRTVMGLIRCLKYLDQDELQKFLENI